MLLCQLFKLIVKVIVKLNNIYYTMASTDKSQANEKEGDSPLNELMENAGVTTPEELAALISARSGEKISASTLRRRFKEGEKGWRKLKPKFNSVGCSF